VGPIAMGIDKWKSCGEERMKIDPHEPASQTIRNQPWMPGQKRMPQQCEPTSQVEAV